MPVTTFWLFCPTSSWKPKAIQFKMLENGGKKAAVFYIWEAGTNKYLTFLLDKWLEWVIDYRNCLTTANNANYNAVWNANRCVVEKKIYGTGLAPPFVNLHSEALHSVMSLSHLDILDSFTNRLTHIHLLPLTGDCFTLPVGQNTKCTLCNWLTHDCEPGSLRWYKNEAVSLSKAPLQGNKSQAAPLNCCGFF